MKRIGVLFGMENSFPGALVEHINARAIDGIEAEFVQTGAVHIDSTPPSTEPSSSTTHSGGRPTTSFSTTRWPRNSASPCRQP
jgi:hypothetical protein